MYDEQFRLKIAMDPAKSWASVDSEFGLCTMGISATILISMDSALKSNVCKTTVVLDVDRATA